MYSQIPRNADPRMFEGSERHGVTPALNLKSRSYLDLNRSCRNLNLNAGGFRQYRSGSLVGCCGARGRKERWYRVGGCSRQGRSTAPVGGFRRDHDAPAGKVRAPEGNSQNDPRDKVMLSQRLVTSCAHASKSVDEPQSRDSTPRSPLLPLFWLGAS